jgi:HAD superfamily phosphoserine phosphatase-like hydrolase
MDCADKSGLNNWKLAGFDIDGTLTSSSVLEHIGTELGFGDEARALTSDYAASRLDNFEVTEQAARRFAGLRPSDMDRILAPLPMVSGIAEVVNELRSLNVRAILCTITFRFAARWIAARYGFDAYSGCELELDGSGRYTGVVTRHFDEFDKLAFVKDQCHRFGIDPSEIFYVGDSRSDIPTFQYAGCSVAFNASEAARRAATFCVDSDDLRDAVSVIPRLDFPPSVTPVRKTR